MVSLVEMYIRTYAAPRHERESPVALLERAAGLGHIGAARQLEREQQKSMEQTNQRDFQEQQSRRMLDLFGNVMLGLPRR